MTKLNILAKCTVEGNVVKLPGEQLERKLYQEVAKALELIGGKWKGGKIMGFVFPTDPTDLLSQIAGGEKRNIKKEFQFFATPSKVADQLVSHAQISEGHSVLEPSAGQGAIIEAVFRAFPRDMKNQDDTPSVTIDFYELMPLNVEILGKKCKEWENRISNMGLDFLEANNRFLYDRVVANPPFTKNQDIDHVMKMYDLTRPGGRIVSIMSTSWQNGSQKKQIAFKTWLQDIGASIYGLESGAFKESGTMIPTVIVVIDK